MNRLPFLLLVSVSLLWSGCSNPTASSGDEEAARRRSPRPGSAYPAFRPSEPQLVNQGGSVLETPTLFAITFAGDPAADDLEAFIANLGGSSYWREASAEYGVQAAVARAPLRLADAAPAQIDDAEIRAWLTTQLDGSHDSFGAPDASTIYTLFYPAGTGVTVAEWGLTGCVNSGGYHRELALGDGTVVVYSVMPRCPTLANRSGLDVVTAVASHELLETVTDPHPDSSPAYRGLDADHFIWGSYYLDEDGDLCVQDQYLDTRPADVGYLVQRMWSNAAARAGHHPCVPSVGAYFNAAPVLPDVVNASRGVSVPVGESRTIELDLFSDAPTGGAWNVTPLDIASLRGQPAELSFSLDKSQGSNGDQLHLTITRLLPSPRGFGGVLVESSHGGVNNFWPALVGQ